ncbi:MAG: type II toxin-antitoxin system MqsA family antitoxin [Campylobacterota bacterium]|nr:type II toxin-antitoxin system MqsA family antitoxin [Campylobacterota bacterium]
MTSCPFCNGIKINSHTTFTVDLGFGIVVVRDVPALVCNQCGSDWIDDTTAEALEQLVDNARKNHAMVEITKYEDLQRAS